MSAVEDMVLAIKIGRLLALQDIVSEYLNSSPVLSKLMEDKAALAQVINLIDIHDKPDNHYL